MNPNRNPSTMKSIIKEFIKKENVVKTDCYKSYPGAVEHINGENIQVSHEIGFKTTKVIHTTNMIENVRSVVKFEVRRRKGIKKTAIPNFLEGII